MKKLFKKLFLDRSLYYRFNIAFMLVALIPISLLAYASYRMIDNRLLKDAHEKIEIGIQTAWVEYYARGKQMMYGMLQAASHEDIKKAVRQKDRGYLRDMMQKWKGKRAYVDIWIIVDDGGKVISRLNSDLYGDQVEINDLVKSALASGKSLISSEVIPEDIMGREEELYRQTPPLIDSKVIEERYKMGKGDGLALMVVTPVADRYGTAGAIITADVLNNDPHIPDAVSARLPWLFTTISLDGLRISTDITDKNGRNTLWTLLPARIASRIGAGEKLLEDWTLDRDFVSVFDPIKDGKGRVIGSLEVSIMKSQLWTMQSENFNAIATVTILGMLLSLLVSLITARRIARPIKLLKQKAIAFVKEEAQTTIPIPSHTDDEISMMDFIYDNMMVELKKRNEERDRHFRELEEKNRQLAELNDRLAEMNEKLEVSHEEIQCQTEELGSANEELRVVNEELEGKIAELREANRSLIIEKEERGRMAQRLMQTEKLSSLGEIISGVAHELNNPLATIMGFSELLIEKECPADVAEKRLKMINDASHRCKQIIDNLLTFARSYKPENIYSDLNRVISGALELKGYQLRVDDIDVETELDPALPKTMLDEHRLQQVFLNLINNAQHAIIEKRKGGGRISISTSFDGDTIRAKVSDTGKGMSDETAKKIFDPFFTTKEVGKGTGLGLSISFGIIKEHGGNISVSSMPDEGATFVIELPVVGAPEKAQALPFPESPTNQPAATGLRALVLDDEPNMLGLLKEVLISSGFRVDATTIGDKALKMLKETSYDLIMSDIKMPGLNGMEFHDRLRTMKPDALDKVIFMTGDSIGKETQDFIKAAGKPFLKKPFTIKELRAEISRHIASLNRGNYV